MRKRTLEPVIVLHPEGVEIPAGIASLEQFREWARSDAYPEKGRIDWVAGRLEVDMSPDDVNTHASPISAISCELGILIERTRLGLVCIQRTRVSSPAADLSAEPDVLVIFFSTLEAGRARLIPKTSKKKGRYVEIEGMADLAVECVSDSSAKKDKVHLREVYHKARVREYWIADVRSDELKFEVLHYRKDGYVPAKKDSRGFQWSEVLEKKVRLRRWHEAANVVLHRLEVEG
jgi:Uma2 family endonuclease